MDNVLVQECPYEPEHVHEYPDDWQFGGACGTDPRADPRFKPDSYYYYNSDLILLHVSSAFICDDEAIDAFSQVATIIGTNPKWIQVRRNGERELQTLPVEYDKEKDEVYDAA